VEVALLTKAAGVLVVNAGSSSLKLRLLNPTDEVVVTADLSATHGRFDGKEVDDVLSSLGTVDAVGHRIVHGGNLFTGPVLIDGNVRQRLESLTSLAPLHQPPALAALDVVSAALPHVPEIACFDTAFHASIPPAAATYAIPEEWRRSHAVRRYGFHGLSHAYAARRAAEMLDRTSKDLRIVTCHLGAGASLAAVRGGVSVDTTMGFTPLEGLVMATRSGTIDPGIIPWLEQNAGLAVEEIADALERRSGVAGLAGTSDMREVIESAEAGDPDARLAVDVYLHRLCGSVAAMVASLGGLDVLVFTGRVGERAAPIRERAVEALRWLGAELDAERNRAVEADAEISAPGAAVSILVIESREDLEIARQVREVLFASD
jgi:acetate kinase